MYNHFACTPPKTYVNPDGTPRSDRPTPNAIWVKASKDPIVWGWDDDKEIWIKLQGLDTVTIDFKAVFVRSCECGSESTGSDKHSSWCPKGSK